MVPVERDPLMRAYPKVKICGITRAADATAAARAGAAYLGFIFYPKSPRGITEDDYRRMRGSLPDLPRVYVQVNPDREELDRARELGFSRFQIHFPVDTPPATVAGWADSVGAAHLWLAPKRPPGVPFPKALLPLAQTFLVDTFRADAYGGSGKTGDWDGFRRLSEAYPDRNWVLAGGLTPDNVAEAVRCTGARVIDVSSGVESAPGRKDAGKIRKFFAALGGPEERPSGGGGSGVTRSAYPR